MGNYCGKICFNIYDEPGYNYINRTDRKQFLQTVQVNITTIDDFVRFNRIRRLDFIEIDVESYKDKVIEGAHKTMATHRPKIICEIFEGNRLAIPAERLISEVVSLGYSPFITKDRETCPYVKHSELPLSKQAVRQFKRRQW
jgi:hypothetical protein